MRGRAARAALVALAAFALAAPRVRAAEPPCDHVVLYSCCEDSTGEGSDRGWRLFDPLHDRDRLLLPPGCGGLRWDSAFTFVEFETKDTLYRMPWREGAKPRALVALPSVAGVCAGWWNPVAHEWRAVATREVGPSGSARADSAADSLGVEWWFRAPDSDRWQLGHAHHETRVGLAPPGYDLASIWREGEPHEPRVAYEDLQLRLVSDRPGEALATLSVEFPREAGTGGTWTFVSSRPGSEVGFAFREIVPLGSRPPFPEAELCFVNRSAQTTKLLWGDTRERSSSVGWAIDCDRLLLSPFRGEARLFDANTGELLRTFPTTAPVPAVWLPRPRR